MLEELKRTVYEANMMLPKFSLVTFTWGNVSQRDPNSGFIVIKPSGVPYEEMAWEQMVVLSPEGDVVEGALNPSSDAPTHVYLYKAFPKINGLVHTHSTYATSFAQAREGIPCLGTTHADYFYGEVPCTRELNEKEVLEDYEKNTGAVIEETFMNKDYLAIPGVLVANHGVFAWGNSGKKAVENAVVIEEISKMAVNTKIISNKMDAINQYIMNKHYYRKHGEGAYYGQKQ